MTIIGTIMFALRKRAFWGSDIIYHRGGVQPSRGARFVVTVAGAVSIVLGILVMLNWLPS